MVYGSSRNKRDSQRGAALTEAALIIGLICCTSFVSLNTLKHAIPRMVCQIHHIDSDINTFYEESTTTCWRSQFRGEDGELGLPPDSSEIIFQPQIDL